MRTFVMAEKMVTKSDGKKMDKSKKTEKPPPDPHREYLDMDSDEEEFGKPETPEPEEELPPEPEKPVFDDKQLDELVRCVKDLTILPTLNDTDWNDHCNEIVQNYFCDPSKLILSIYYEEDVLKALLDFPDHWINSLTYFLRSPWQVYTPENFHDTVIFGSISGNVENAILKILENLYSPLVFQSNSWPSVWNAVMRNAIYSNMHDLLTRLIDVAYKSSGLTILYVPRENLAPSTPRTATNSIPKTDNDNAKSSSDDGDEIKNTGELSSRLETIANSWIRQMRKALTETNDTQVVTSIADVLSFWNYRYDNLSSLQLQLNHKHVTRVIEQIGNVQPTSIEQFKELAMKIQEAIDRAGSNITYLNLLVEPCTHLGAPDIKDERIKTILCLVTFIWEESPNYNTAPQMEMVCEALSTQVVEECRKSIDLDMIFQGDTTRAKQSLQACIRCCKRYENIYDKHISLVSAMNLRETWTIRKNIVFNKVLAFVGRCRDVMEICEAIEVFGRSPEPLRFCGSNGVEHERYCDNVENMFYDELKIIERIRLEIFDVSKASWTRNFALFRAKLAEFDVMIRNLINIIFAEVRHLEEGIEALYTLRRYRSCISLSDHLHLKWIDLWKMFDDEISKTQSTIVDQVDEHHQSFAYYSGRALILRLRQYSLSRSQSIMIDASDWLGDCEAQTIILRNYKKLSGAINNEELILFETWEKKIPEETYFAGYFNETILIREKNQSRAIRVNIDYGLLDALQEAKTWLTLGHDVKPFLKKFANKWSTLKLRHDAVARVSQLYNTIFDILAEEDQLLFEKFTEHTDNLVAAGLEKLSWNGAGVEKFYADCVTELSNIQGFIRYFNDANTNIEILCRTVDKLSFFIVEDLVSCKLKEFISCLEDQRNQTLLEIVRCRDEVYGYICSVREVFEPDFTEIGEYWELFLLRKDERFRDALCSALCTSLTNALKFIVEERDDESAVLIEIEADYSDSEVKVSQDVRDACQIFRNLFEFFLESLQPLVSYSEESDQNSTVYELLDSIALDDSCLNVKEEISSAIGSVELLVEEFLHSCDCFKDVSTINVSDIAKLYAIDQPCRDNLERDISRCARLVDAVEALPDTVAIKIVLLDLKRAKTKIIDYCETWRDVLCIELSKIIVTEQKFDVGSPNDESVPSYTSSCKGD